MSKSFTGKFQITNWQETTFQEGEAESKQSYAKVSQQYTGDLEGTSSLQYLMCYQTKSHAIFTGFEQLDVKVSGKSGQFIIQHHGKFVDGVASSVFSVVAESATGDLSGLTGSGEFCSTENGQADYKFLLNL